MKLNALIQKCKDTFPTLYQHREDVLDHLYCTIGNGYAWRPDGTIGSDGVVEENYPKCTLRQAVTEGVDQDGGQLIKMLHKRYVEKEGKKALSFAKFRKQYIDRRVAEEANRPKRDYFYPLYSDGPRYALVQNVPDNVQQDYLDGAFEVLELVINMKGHLTPTFKGGVEGDTLAAKMQERARAKAIENAKQQQKEDAKSREEAQRILKELEGRFPGRKALVGEQRVAVPRRCEPYFYLTDDDLNRFEIGDRVTLKFGEGFRVAKKYKGKRVNFTVNNFLEHNWRRQTRRLALIPEGGTDKDVLILDDADRFECLMIDLFACNRKPFAEW